MPTRPAGVRARPTPPASRRWSSPSTIPRVNPHNRALDGGSVEDEVAQDVRRIHDELGLTTVMVTHDMTEALLLADRIAVMRDGALVQLGTPRELVTQPADDFVTAMLETPRRRAAALAAALS